MHWLGDDCPAGSFLDVLIALSGYAQSEDRRRALEAGFDGFAAKPASPVELMQAIARILAERGS